MIRVLKYNFVHASLCYWRAWYSVTYFNHIILSGVQLEKSPRGGGGGGAKACWKTFVGGACV